MEREILDVDVLFVGGGIAGLAGAFHLSAIAAKKSLPISIAVIDKAREPGNHSISGAVMDPVAMRELLPDYIEQGMPVEGYADKEELVFLTENMSFPVFLIPPFMRNKGYPIVSMSKVNAWLCKILEQRDVNIFFGYPGAELLLEGESVAGIRCADTGVDKYGGKKESFRPGPDIKAKVTVLAEGGRGSLTKQAVGKFQLDDGTNKQGYTLAVKEAWEFEQPHHEQGLVMNTMGYPLPWDTFGGGFIYAGGEKKLFLGIVAGMDSPDPFLDAHEKLQKLKSHKRVAELVRGGKLAGYGARVIPEGGWFALPRLYANGVLITGDAAGFVNSMRIKGVHLAIKSGMLAAETILEAFQKNDFTERALSSYGKKIRNSWIYDEMRPSRNFHQAFQRGLARGGFLAGIQTLFRGWSFKDRIDEDDDYKHMKKRDEYGGNIPLQEFKAYGISAKSKEDCLYFSGTGHEENQPCHLVIEKPEICGEQCRREFGNPCVRFCPAKVYEMEEENGKYRLQLNPSNCLHCKACDVRDPYGIITWKCPEGGGGPRYTGM